MKRGPKPKLKTLEQLALESAGGELMKPSWLSKGASRIWDEQVANARAVKAKDSAAFADFCQCLYRLRQMEARIEREGLIVQGDKGKRKNPACQLAREYRIAVQRWAPEFGMTPSAGTKIMLSASEKQQEIERATAGRPNLLSGQWRPGETTQ